MKNAIHMLSPGAHHKQLNSFVITTEGGKIIVVDGGFAADAEYLLKYLRELCDGEKPHVDAWFLSHAHCDHVSAFTTVMDAHFDEIEVDRIYYNFPSVQYFQRSEGEAGHDAASTLARFYELLPKFADKACIVFGGDTYDIGEAKFEILYSPDCNIETNVGNNSSVVFKLTLGQKTALFLGDCGIEEGENILKKYGESGILKCDICQMAHHGQSGCNKEFYAAVRPHTCLWCAPGWLWDNDHGEGFDTFIYQTVTVRGWMDELGVKEHYVMMDGTQICPM